MKTHMSTARPDSASSPNIQRHGANSNMAWPSVGASIGTARKTMNVSDITFAIARPAKRSRTIDTASTLVAARSEEHTSELQSLMRISYAVFCLKKKQHPPKHDSDYSTSDHQSH